MSARSCCRVWGPMVLVACAVPICGQAPSPRPPDLFVTRLQGPGSAGPPSRPAAPQHPSDLQPLPVTELDQQQPNADLDGPRRVSLTVSRPMPLTDLLLLLVNGTPISLVNDDGVDGSFVGDLKDLSMRQAFEAVLFPRGLDYDVHGTLVRVFARKTSTRFFNVNYLNVRRSLQREVRGGTSTAGVQGSSASLSSSSSSDFFDDLENGVTALLSASGRVHVDRTAGLVQVTDFADRLDRIGVYVETAELRATRQVRIDAHVFELAFADGAVSSIDWKAVSTRSGPSPQPSSEHFRAGLPIGDLDGLKRALGEQGTLTTLAAPQVVAMNNAPAVIRIGTEVAYLDPSTSRTRESDLTSRKPGTALEGLTLTVLPQIAADGVVLLHVSPSYASRVEPVRSADHGRVPLVRMNEADTVVRVQDGETILLAGFLGEREITKASSGLAAMFGGPSRTTVKTELVILLTPTIVAPTPGAMY